MGISSWEQPHYYDFGFSGGVVVLLPLCPGSAGCSDKLMMGGVLVLLVFDFPIKKHFTAGLSKVF